MDSTIQEVRPDELAAVVTPGEVTLVLAAPGTGSSQQLRSVGQPVDRLPETTKFDDELVIVEDFVAAVFALEDELLSTYCHEYGEKSLFARADGAVLLACPRSFDWLCQSDRGVSDQFVGAIDSVLLVRTPPTAVWDAVDDTRRRINTRSLGGLRDTERAAILERAWYPPYAFETPELRRRLGWYGGTVTPAAFLSLSKNDDSPAIMPEDVRRAFGDHDVSSGAFDEQFVETISRLVPNGGLPSRIPNDRSPPVLAAVALVAIGLASDADWLDSFDRYRVLPATAAALERNLDLPPGTVDHLRVFAATPARAAIRDHLDEAGESAVDVARSVLRETADALGSEQSSLEAISTEPDAFDSHPLVGSWHWDGLQTLSDSAAERELPASSRERNGSHDKEGADWTSLVDRDELLEALDGGLVILSGPKTSGKRRLAASLASELSDWGSTVLLPDLSRPSHIRTGVDATPNAVVIATYGAEPARITGGDGVRALPEWVADGSCAGAVLICDDSDRERLEHASERAACEELAAWNDRVEFVLEDPNDVSNRDPAVVAGDLLEAIGWNRVQSPSRRTVDIEPVRDQSTLAAVAGCPDHALEGEFVGNVVAAAIDTLRVTHDPTAAEQWLSFIDELVADVGRNRNADAAGPLRYRGEVYGTAIAAVATADPTTNEWVHAIARNVSTLTNETATPNGQESVGGDLEPFATTFAGALAILVDPPAGERINHAAVGCVDQTLHDMVSEDGSQFPLHFVYGSVLERIVHRFEDPTAADASLVTILSLVRQRAMEPNDWATAGVLQHAFGSMLGAVAGAERSPEALSAWVTDIGSRARDSVSLIADPDAQTSMLEGCYGAGIGLWVFEHGCPDDAFVPWLEAVGTELSRTAVKADIDDPEAFVTDAYGQAVRSVVQTGDLERAEQSFSNCHRLVDAIASSARFANERALRSSLHAKALAAFGDVELEYPDEVGQYPYGTDSIPFDDALGFEDWIELYDRSVMQGDVADTAVTERGQYVTDIYCGVLSTHARGFDADSDGGVTPRGEHAWYSGLVDRIDSRATTAESIDDPATFLVDVFGDAAVRWAAEGAPSRTQEWLEVLGQSLRTCQASIDKPATSAWDDAFASTDAEVLAAALTRTDVGERTHDRLVDAVVSRIEADATAPTYSPHPSTHIVSVFGGALALAADGPPEAVRFGIAEVLIVLENEVSPECDELERATRFERVYAAALAKVGRSDTNDSRTVEWLDIVTDRIETTARREMPERPAEFVAAVYARALCQASRDGVDEWYRRLDATLREFAMGPSVDDPAAFLERVYAGVIRDGATGDEPEKRIERCIEFVDESIRTAVDANVIHSADAFERVVEQAADRLSAATQADRDDAARRLGHGLRETGHRTLADETVELERTDT
ncbi:hypothetical protein EL22_09915 [Halostagnicola sp. A56]|uniref:hypothetical protein n=1 Tax=Halostagnicola sp. A56 TaxID=1495067 RepID=UPI00049FF5A3|nr:hypothetical protein [Halostagnicola sp. A56]KDE57763.1 hypothetical protein EL22_09915 [Halostagnicola sp. A56]